MSSKFCPCGCAGVVKPGRTYASKGCAPRSGNCRRKRGPNVHDIFVGNGKKKNGSKESWWALPEYVGNREKFQERAKSLAPQESGQSIVSSPNGRAL